MRATAGVLVLVPLAVASLGCGPAPDAGVVIDSPRERQVIQRDDDGTAPVEIRGSWNGEEHPAAPEIRVVTGDGTALPWTPLALTDDRFVFRWRLPQGGWHRLEFRSGPESAPSVAVRRFGIGEVFVVAGQSNATNWGELTERATNDRVSAWDGTGWSIARDPMPGVQDGSEGGSPWPVFGALLETALDVPVGLAAVGHGNTSILDWQAGSPPRPDGPGKPLYPALRSRVEELGKVRAVLWHQGERDVWEGTGGDRYVDAFVRLRDALARDTGTPAPWLVAQASYEPGSEPESMATIRRAQQRLWNENIALRGPDTDALVGDGSRAADGVHFSAAGLEAHARAWHEAVLGHELVPR